MIQRSVCWIFPILWGKDIALFVLCGPASGSNMFKRVSKREMRVIADWEGTGLKPICGFEDVADVARNFIKQFTYPYVACLHRNQIQSSHCPSGNSTRANRQLSSQVSLYCNCWQLHRTNITGHNFNTQLILINSKKPRVNSTTNTSFEWIGLIPGSSLNENATTSGFRHFEVVLDAGKCGRSPSWSPMKRKNRPPRRGRTGEVVLEPTWMRHGTRSDCLTRKFSGNISNFRSNWQPSLASANCLVTLGLANIDHSLVSMVGYSTDQQLVIQWEVKTTQIHKATVWQLESNVNVQQIDRSKLFNAFPRCFIPDTT